MQIKLYEGSIVTFPMNTLATIASVKARISDQQARSLKSGFRVVTGVSGKRVVLKDDRSSEQKMRDRITEMIVGYQGR